MCNVNDLTSNQLLQVSRSGFIPHILPGLLLSCHSLYRRLCSAFCSARAHALTLQLLIRMPPFVPTPREIFLLCLLLIGLLTFSTTIKPSTVTDLTKIRSGHYTIEDEVEEAPSTFEAQYSLQTLNVPLSWGLGQVPETQIVAHVPGTHRNPCQLHHGLITL